MSDYRHIFWRAWAPGHIKIFSWLLHRNRLWCNDRLQRRGWPNNYFCQWCFRNLESSAHLFWECNVSLAIWRAAATWVGCEALKPAGWSGKKSTTEIVSAMIETTKPEYRKGIRTMILIILWEIWKQRNACTFRTAVSSQEDILATIKRDVELWRQAGATCIEHPMGGSRE